MFQNLGSGIPCRGVRSGLKIFCLGIFSHPAKVGCISKNSWSVEITNIDKFWDLPLWDEVKFKHLPLLMACFHAKFGRFALHQANCRKPLSIGEPFPRAEGTSKLISSCKHLSISISSKSVLKFLSYFTHRQTHKQAHRQKT